ncbi:MAG: UvrD-helicase domain-containing protein [Prochlorococcus sp.]
MDQANRKPEFRFEANEYPLGPGLRLLEASAGTGKTFALAHLVLRLLTEGGRQISQLLVVTFTESAAAELRSRIGKRLEDALKGLESFQHQSAFNSPDPVLDQWLLQQGSNSSKRNQWICSLLEALEGLDRADITTIHGFCRRTLRRQALESGAAVDPRLDDTGAKLAIEVAHDYWQQQILALAPQHVRGLQHAGLSVENLAKALLKVDGDPSLDLDIHLSNLQSSHPLVSQFDNYLQSCWQQFSDQWKRHGAELDAALSSRSADWRSLGAQDTKPFSPKPKKDRCDILTRWLEVLSQDLDDSDHSFVPSYGTIRDQTLLKDYFHPAVVCNVARRCGEVNPAPLKPSLQKSIADLCDGPAEEVWTHALHWGINALVERRRRRGVMSYAELLSALDPKSQTKVTNQPHCDQQAPWLDALRRRYRVALIDEFQDTDPVQWRLLEQAFAHSPDHLLLMVGDPKQAIYRFRGGDLNTYLDARSKVDRIDALIDNFRTTTKLLDGLNQLMAPGLRRSNLGCPPLTARSDATSLPLPLGVNPLQLLNLDDATHSTGAQPASLSSKTKLEEQIPTAVAHAVLDLLQSDSCNLKPADICILVGRHRQAASIREGLALAGVPTRLVSQGDVLNSEAAQVLQRFLDCLARPAHSSSLRLVACSALMQWNTQQLADAESNGELDQLALRFRNWATNLPRLGLMGCLAELLEGRTIADLSERGRLLGDLYQCAQLVQEVIHRQGLDASTAADWLRRQRLQPVDPASDDRQPHSDVAESAVAVVTVHRSKGMEYSVVICPYLWQVPFIPSGPLWRSGSESRWCVALSTGWGKGWELAQEGQNAYLQEAERLAYVAITRACSLLMLVWARGSKQEGNPLISWLFGPDAIDASMQDLTSVRMNDWLDSQRVEISVLPAQLTLNQRHWRAPPPAGELVLGPIPQRLLDRSWGRSSYSAWVSGVHRNDGSASSDPLELEEGRDRQQKNPETSPNLQGQSAIDEAVVFSQESTWSEQGPLAQFPRGAGAGDCLHRILERLDFCKPLQDPNAVMVIEEELRRAGLDINLRAAVQDGLERVLNTPIGSVLGDLCLNQLHEKRRIHELSFDLPIAHQGKVLRSLDLARAFQLDPMARFGETYAKQISNLSVWSRGFLTGSIDLVFTDSEDLAEARWWVADWKSNWIGRRNPDGQVAACGPFHYDEGGMEQQMLLHHYPLQAHLYLVALHRFLRWRLPNYQPERHLGGYVYVFLRGVPGAKAMAGNSLDQPVPGLIVEPSPLQRVMFLDRLLEQGGQ